MGIVIKIKQATKLGYAKMKNGGVCDLSYLASTKRRGRVQGGGCICPTITTNPNALHLIKVYEKRTKTLKRDID